MKTAVKWYNSKVIELMTQREQENIDVFEFRNQLDLLLTEANKMFEEQIIDAYRINPNNENWSNSGIDYYKETFKSE
jgi:hypothetical protein